MRIVMPYAGEEPRAPVPPRAELIEMVDDYSYGNLLADLWESGDDFCIVEHDIVVTEDDLEALDACEKEYCAAPYNLGLGRGLGAALGCVRFRGTFTVKYPHAPKSWRSTHWDRLDGAVELALSGAPHPHASSVLMPHLHVPVVHLHFYSGDFPTDDPTVVIEWQTDEWVRYRNLMDGRVWKETRSAHIL